MRKASTIDSILSPPTPSVGTGIYNLPNFCELISELNDNAQESETESSTNTDSTSVSELSRASVESLDSVFSKKAHSATNSPRLISPNVYRVRRDSRVRIFPDSPAPKNVQSARERAKTASDLETDLLSVSIVRSKSMESASYQSQLRRLSHTTSSRQFLGTSQAGSSPATESNLGSCIKDQASPIRPRNNSVFSPKCKKRRASSKK